MPGWLNRVRRDSHEIGGFIFHRPLVLILLDFAANQNPPPIFRGVSDSDLAIMYQYKIDYPHGHASG